jgi:penicillin-binding protein 1A
LREEASVFKFRLKDPSKQPSATPASAEVAKATRSGWRQRGWAIDSWIDSSISESWDSLKDRWNGLTSFFARCRLTGWKRGLNELLSEGLTLTAAGLSGVLVLALPAFLEFDESKIAQGQYSVKFLDKNGNEIGKRGILQNDAIPLEDIPDHLIKATLATEDRRFFEHFGVDVLGTARALMANAQAGETVQGGSTLTQQLAKNLFLTSERSLQRKLKELFMAFLLESRFTKREILKMYLDRAYMGGGAFGVEAAAQFYFGKSVREVTLAEAAMMAGLYKAPTKYAPHVNLPASRGRANEVLSNLVEAGYMTAGQVHSARLNPAVAVTTRSTSSPDWFLDWAFEEVQRLAEGRGQFALTVRTTIDLGLQQAAEDALQSTIRQYGKTHNARSGAIVSMEPDGAVRALVGGLDYGESQFNRATAARRQPGSSFKLYVYAAALENGFNVNSSVRDNGVSCGNWSPKNYDGSSGSGRGYTLRDAFKVSLNTIAVDLSLYKLGNNSRDKIIEMTERLGVAGVKKSCSMALGDTGVSPLQHTGAYAVFANGGKSARPYAIIDMFSQKGDLVYSRERDEPAAGQIVQPRYVEQMNQMLQAVVLEGTGKRATLEFTHAVGKTGTSSSYRDAWFMGFSGQYVTGVWIGNDDFRPMIIQPGARTGNATGVTGGGLPAIAWQNYMAVAHTNMNIPTIPGLQAHPRQVQEVERMAAQKRLEPAVAGAQGGGTSRRNSIMPDQTRGLLQRLADTMRRTAGLPEPAAPPARQPGAPLPAPARPQQGMAPPEMPAPSNRDRRADAQLPAATVRP